jgi:hypothetical protein
MNLLIIFKKKEFYLYIMQLTIKEYIFILIFCLVTAVTLYGFIGFLHEKQETIPVILKVINKEVINDIQINSSIFNSGEVIGKIIDKDVSCDGNEAIVIANITVYNFDGVIFFEGYYLTKDRVASFMMSDAIVEGIVIALNKTVKQEQTELLIELKFPQNTSNEFICGSIKDISILEVRDELHMKISLPLLKVGDNLYYHTDDLNDGLILLQYPDMNWGYIISDSYH